jgi:hypothetical protein
MNVTHKQRPIDGGGTGLMSRLTLADDRVRPNVPGLLHSCRGRGSLLILGVLLFGNWALADGFWSQFSDPDDQRFDASTYLAENAYGFLPVPIIITDPAVDGGLGAVGLFFHETDDQKQKRLEALKSAEDGSRYLLTPSVSAVAAAVTGNDSWFVGGGHMGFFKQGRIRYLGGGGYGDVNLDFFGFGNISFTSPVELNTKAWAAINELKFRIGNSPIFIGAAQRYIKADISPRRLGDLNGDFLPPEFQEAFQDQIRRLLTRDVTTSALGVTAEFDTRDNLFSPHSGYRYEIRHLFFRDAVGSDVEYELTSFSGVNYWRLGDQLRAGLRLAAEHANTDTLLPPFATPGIELRGVPALRYQGNYVAVAEAELTWQIDDRWAVLGFAGSGRAANSFDELKDGPSRVAKGFGFRYLIARRYGFEMGIDIARGPEEDVFYIQAGTAWK